MKAIHTKLLRDLWRLRTQVVTIALVVAVGVAGFVGMFSVHESLLSARDAFYRDNRLADVFVTAKRAPVHLRDRLQAIDGVQAVQLTVQADAQIDLPGVDAPVTGRFVGLELARAQAGRQGLNALTLVKGRWPERGNALEAVVNDRFATVRGLRPGDAVHAVLNGRRERVVLVGTAISPEYVFASRGGAPDDQTFGLWWVDGQRLEDIFDLQGAFNQAALRLHAGVPTAPVMEAVDRLLSPYGSLGAVDRHDQLSARIVEDELSQLKVLGTVLPSIFLAVAMFVLNVVLGRQVATQRSQIAALKALGYGDAAIAAHYIELALVIAGLGVAAGLALSGWIGRLTLGLYDEVFRFNQLVYATPPWLLLAATGIAALAAAAGTWAAIHQVVRLSPAQAMQPPTPPSYQATLLERLGLGRHLGPGGMMVVRNFERRPLRSLFTVGGIAAAVALQISGAFWLDAIAHVVDVQFRQVQPGNVLLSFHQPVRQDVVRELLRLPGVQRAEPLRSEPVRVIARGARVDTTLQGTVPGAQLLRVVDAQQGPIELPEHGIALSHLLARELGVGLGDTVEIEFRLWHRARATLTVSAIVNNQMGKPAYLPLAQMNRLSRDGDAVTSAALQVQPQAMPAFWAAVKQAPVIDNVFDKQATLASFEATTSRNMGVLSAILTVFAVAMAVGITYNAARIALSERAWELASLRVLGMTRAEVSALLLAPLALELLLALPLGAAAGWGLAKLLMALMSSENIEFPVIVAPATYGWAVLIVLAAGVASALVVRRRIDHLNLVAVLKVRE